jgi:hypothetical protein
MDNGFPMTMDNGQWTMLLGRHFLDFFNTNKCNALHHWIDHVKISRMVIFQL